ncbi:MAG: DMT family transporter [Burkholderiales bacterium]|nr:DMT family transporter [Burkholderiales bacterium]
MPKAQNRAQDPARLSHPAGPLLSPDTRHPLDGLAVGAMIAMCALWGFQQVAVKLAAPGVSFVMQSAIRSAFAFALVLAWARLRRIPLVVHDRTLAPGALAGALFACEFAAIYGGLAHTTAARMVVFLYTAPCFTALGLALFVPGERLTALQWTGVALAFAGIAFAFRDGLATGERTLLGDALGVLAAIGWAVTTVLIRATTLARASATRVLAYQLGVSALLLPLFSVALGEPGVVALTPVAVASLAYQTVIVAFATYLAWFWLLTRYLASRLSVFSFLTPLFGVGFGHAVLGDPLTPTFVGAALLVGAGIVLVNLRTLPMRARAAP